MPVSARSRGRVSTARVKVQSRASGRREEPSFGEALRAFLRRQAVELAGLLLLFAAAALVATLLSFSPSAPNLNHATSAPAHNWLGTFGAAVADLVVQTIGLGAAALVLPMIAWGWHLLHRDGHALPPVRRYVRLLSWPLAMAAVAGFAAAITPPASWPFATGLGGLLGDVVSTSLAHLFDAVGPSRARFLATMLSGLVAVLALWAATGFGARELWRVAAALVVGYRWAFEQIDEAWTRSEPARARFVQWWRDTASPAVASLFGAERDAAPRIEPSERRRARPVADEDDDVAEDEDDEGEEDDDDEEEEEGDDEDDRPATNRVIRSKLALKSSAREKREAQRGLDLDDDKPFVLPPLSLLAKPKPRAFGTEVSEEALEQTARLLEAVLEEFGVRGEVLHVRPGPVVTLYELRPAPGIKSSRVIGLSDDIARSMSAVSARVAVIPGRNVIGIELPNQRREMVMLRELLAADEYEKSQGALTLALGKTIGGEPVLADLATMPHLLVAGTTGSGKSVAINTMILSLVYRLPPSRCRMILVDPKMLELSVYDGIPHLLAPVVTEPKKAVVALKWVVKEMEGRYRKMSKLGVRNITGFNARLADAVEKGETLRRTVQTGFDRETGKPIFEHEEMDFEPLPYIVVVVDEMADLMMVAGKDIEAAVQRLAQMARAAGIHLITATQRPSVDVITGTIKANFPTRISFQVTSKIDSRTILGEQGAEQLLGQGDMLYMAGGGRIRRVHGPFVSDQEVEEVVAHLKRQSTPDYLDAVTEGGEDEEGEEGLGLEEMGGSSGDEMYDQAVAIVARERRVSVSYIQRRLMIGYNRAARIVEQMEEQGVVSPPNRQGKREILVGDHSGDDD